MVFPKGVIDEASSKTLATVYDDGGVYKKFKYDFDFCFEHYTEIFYLHVEYGEKRHVVDTYLYTTPVWIPGTVFREKKIPDFLVTLIATARRATDE